MATWVLYGATGYTGQRLAHEAVKRGHSPLLAGRDAAKLERLASELKLDWKAVPLDDSKGLRTLLDGHGAVLHAAGPFVRTSKPMADACLAVGTHYLDITGEVSVFEALYARDEEAQSRRLSLIPGVGFDVVPTDCLAVWLANKVEKPVALEMSLAAIGQPSGGTAKSALGMMLDGGLVRRDGKLVRWPLGRGVKRVRFSTRERWVATAPLADLSSAFRSTGIRDITMSMAVSSRTAKAMKLGWPLAVASLPAARLLFSSGRARNAVEGWVERHSHPPEPGQPSETRCSAWAQVTGKSGETREGWIETGEGYEFTQHSGIRAVERVLRERPSGALTPAQAFGEDFVMEFDGVRRLDAL